MEEGVLKDIPIEEITRVISVSAAPAFLLGAIVGMLSLLVGRLARLQDQAAAVSGVRSRGDHMQRMHRIRMALVLCVLSGIGTGLMVNLVFVDTLFGWQNNRTIVLMFIIAIVFFTLSLIFFLLEILAAARAGER
ncbi:hypothetical protein LMIY3S_05589 [Labrys miyagiensis]